jgi:putative SOS response-associated peptidase YedK
MCNLYSMTKTQDAIRDLFDIKLDSTGNLRSFPAIFPDNEAPEIRNTSGGRELRLMRWVSRRRRKVICRSRISAMCRARSGGRG